MKAIITNIAGGVEKLIQVEIPAPKILSNEFLVKVKAIGINPVDVKTRASDGMLTGLFGGADPKIIGWDLSGIVIEIGTDVTAYKIGDEVFGMVNFPGHGKGDAEYVAVPASQLSLKPSNGDDMQAIARLLQEQIVVSHVSNVFPFNQIAEAHLQVETGRTKGKVVVTI